MTGAERMFNEHVAVHGPAGIHPAAMTSSEPEL